LQELDALGLCRKFSESHAAVWWINGQLSSRGTKESSSILFLIVMLKILEIPA
jgi:hypothetical protein